MTSKEKYNAYRELLEKLREYCSSRINKDGCIECKLSICYTDVLFNFKISYNDYKKIMEERSNIDWNKVPVGTKIYFTDDSSDEWCKAYFSKYIDREVYACNYRDSKPFECTYAKLIEE